MSIDALSEDESRITGFGQQGVDSCDPHRVPKLIQAKMFRLNQSGCMMKMQAPVELVGLTKFQVGLFQPGLQTTLFCLRRFKALVKLQLLDLRP